jgi:hypothetical protein
MIANTMIGDDQPRWDDNAESDVSVIILQPEQHNISERSNEQARYAASAGATSMIISSVDADDHNSPSSQPSRQDGPEHLSSPSLLSPASPGVIYSSATGLIGGSEEESILLESTRHGSLSSKSI